MLMIFYCLISIDYLVINFNIKFLCSIVPWAIKFHATFFFCWGEGSKKQ